MTLPQYITIPEFAEDHGNNHKNKNPFSRKSLWRKIQKGYIKPRARRSLNPLRDSSSYSLNSSSTEITWEEKVTRFSATVEVYYTISHRDYTAEERRASWYKFAELRKMNNERTDGNEDDQAWSRDEWKDDLIVLVVHVILVLLLLRFISVSNTIEWLGSVFSLSGEYPRSLKMMADQDFGESTL
jgi:hypothetical protein